MNYKHVGLLVKILFLLILYYLTARIGLLFGAVSGFATLIWIPSGVALAMLLLFGLRLWPAVAIAAFFVNLTIGATIPNALLISVGNTLEPIITTLILRSLGFNFSLSRAKDVYYFTLAIAIGSIISASMGTTSLLINHATTLSLYLPTMGAWGFGDFISMLVLTPFILTWTTGYKNLVKNFSYSKLFEGIALLLCILLLTGFIYWSGPGIFKNAPKAYLIYPFLIWTALNFGIMGSTAVLLLIFCMAIIGSILNIGPLVYHNIAIRLALTEGFLTITTITTFILAAINMERKDFDKRKDDFISMASHELKTPLTSAKILMQVLLKQSSKNSHTLNMFGKMNTHIDRLINLVNELLDVTKIGQERLELKNEVFNTKPVLKEIIEELQLTTRHQLVIKEARNAYVSADKQRFSQVITNVITNAIKFSPDKSKIIITSKLQNNFLILSIQDFGIGIPKSEQTHVFDRFYQIKNNNRHTYPGLGIGLFIVKESISRMGGKVWLESDDGAGSTFYFSFPIINNSSTN